jgi:hypothetical protein
MMSMLAAIHASPTEVYYTPCTFHQLRGLNCARFSSASTFQNTHRFLVAWSINHGLRFHDYIPSLTVLRDSVSFRRISSNPAVALREAITPSKSSHMDLYFLVASRERHVWIFQAEVTPSAGVIKVHHTRMASKAINLSLIALAARDRSRHPRERSRYEGGIYTHPVQASSTGFGAFHVLLG